jgi:hypothetical protein
MAEPSTPLEAARPRVCISYSRADRRRATGLAVLSEALGHHVFIDHRSIVGGRHWRDALEEGLQQADVLLVFWTRHARRSNWVRWEYERFDTQFPDRPLVPVLGDRTPLPDRLQARQSSDLSPPIKPLIKELSDTVRTMKANGSSMRQIRAEVLQRLEAEGIILRRDQRHRLFGLFEIFGLALVPLYFLVDQRDRLVDFLQHQRDRLVDQSFALTAKLSALPPAYYYTAGVAITAGFLTCHGVARGFDTIAYKKGHQAAQVAALSERQAVIDAEVKARVAQEIAQARRELEDTLSRRQAALDTEVKARVAQEIAQAQRQLHDTFEERLKARSRALVPNFFPVDVRLNQSGTDACHAQGMVCVWMSPALRIQDVNGKFFGSSIPPCSATVVRESAIPFSSCSRNFQTNYALKDVEVRRSPRADAGVQDLSRDHFCLSDEKGKQGIYQFANCVKP